MPDKKIFTSEINVLAHLLGGPAIFTVVYDPDAVLHTDDDSGFLRIKGFETLGTVASAKKDKKICVVNLGKQALTLTGLDYIIEFNQQSNYQGMNKIQWQYINNPSGSMRWMYPARIQSPWFLSFYNFNYWKARLYKTVTRLAFMFRFTKLLSHGQVTVYTSGLEVLTEYLLHPGNKERPNYSIFTGTAGPNRKIVLADAGTGAITHFFKIALNNRSAENLQNEFKSLQNLERTIHQDFEYPKAASISLNTICVSNIKPTGNFEQPGFSTIHCNFLHNLYAQGTHCTAFRDIPLTSVIGERMDRIAQHPNFENIHLAPELYNQIKVLHKQFEALNPLLVTARCHGDFTRWNCYQNKHQLHVYDWEFSNPEMPVLYDLFHFVVQGSVFSKNASVQDIRKQINVVLQQDAVQQLLSVEGIEPDLYFRWYLLNNISYYLELYLDQVILHKEVAWLFTAWQQLLQEETAEMAGVSFRKQFTRQFFGILEQSEYVVLKNAGKPINSLSDESDIDILIKPADRRKLIDFARSYSGVVRIKITRKSFMTTLQVFFTDHSFLSIDLLHSFHRKSIKYIDESVLLKNAVVEEGIKILPPAYDYLYIFLFYQINYARVPEKYSMHFSGMEQQQAAQVLEVLQLHCGIQAESLEQTFSNTKAMREQIFQFLKTRQFNNLLSRLFRWIGYNSDTTIDFIKNRGCMLTFSGVDGAGKSTILQEVKDMLQKKYRKKVVVIRHRPSMLPILSAWKYGKEEAERKCVESLPRQGKNKSLLSSIARFAYYYADYMVGQCLVYFKYTLRGYIVLYDRYYFDFIVDGKRSNININKSFIRNLYRFVYKPQLNIFLYAPPDVILKRKKELSAKDITQLTDAYTSLFGKLGHAPQYMCIENIDKGKTMQTIEQAFVQLN